MSANRSWTFSARFGFVALVRVSAAIRLAAIRDPERTGEVWSKHAGHVSPENWRAIAKELRK